MRVAERRGLLTGPGLSMVQQLGVELLVLADGWAQEAGRRQAEEERLRLALVAAGVDPEQALGGREEAPEDDGDVVEGDDYADVSWETESTPDEWGALQAAMSQARERVTDQGASPEFREAGPAVPDVDFDREWQ